MEKSKKEKLKNAGWNVGSVADFLNLSNEETAIIELRLALSEGVKNIRIQSNMTQTGFASKLGTSQSRLNKIEAGDASVSLDLLIKSLVRSGLNVTDIANIMVGKEKVPSNVQTI